MTSPAHSENVPCGVRSIGAPDMTTNISSSAVCQWYGQ